MNQSVTRHLLLLALCFFAGRHAYALQVSFASDTLYACAQEPFTLSPSVAGGSGGYTYLWSNGETGSTVTQLFSPGFSSFWVKVTDSSGDIDSASVMVHILAECVWPGDFNGDAVANNYDVLFWGRGFGNSGPLRPQAHTNWIGQAAFPWTHTFSSGTNYVHADGNGDGQINWNDPAAILHNYFAPNSASGLSPIGLPGAVPLTINFPAMPSEPGDTLTVPILLGNADFPADSISGIAFSVIYDNSLIDSGSVHITYNNSWMGQQGTTLHVLDKDFYAQGQVDIALTTLGANLVNGYGRIADISVMIDDIIGKRQGIEMVRIEIQNVTLTGKNGQLIPVKLLSEGFLISLSADQDVSAFAVDVFPQPASDLLTVTWNPALRPETLDLISPDGRLVKSVQPTSSAARINTADLPGGLYLLHIQNDTQSLYRKVLIR
ncbi:MAG: T9SS C-terminal target domain-containing protein [Bacteroidetes bacterium]|nr:MAG: T9SS C-terminal target domain-containing protein [Bacteroidota bacterium]